MEMHPAIYFVYLLLMMVFYLLILNSFPTVKKMGMKESYIYPDDHYPNYWQRFDVPEWIIVDEIDLSTISKEDLIKYILENKEINKQWWSSEKLIHDDSPGNFTLDKNENGEWILTVYDPWGIAHDSNLNDECKKRKN